MELETDNNLDDEWINNFERTDKLFEDFYKDDLYYVNLSIIYINRNNEIDKVTNGSLLLKKPNYILCEDIIGILKQSSFDNNRRYTLLSMLKYNITLEPEEVKNYLVNGSRENSQYLTPIKNIDTIKFDKSISMFHDLNELILVFYEKSNELVKTCSNNGTKRVFIGSRRKTIKKRYKD